MLYIKVMIKNPIKAKLPYHRVMPPKDAEGNANSKKPDQTAPLDLSVSALFPETYLSKNQRKSWLSHKLAHSIKRQESR